MKTIPDQIRSIRDLANGYKMSQVLVSAEALGVFGALADTPRVATEIAAQVSAPVDRLLPLLNVLVGAGVLAKTGEAYSIAEEFSTLNPSHPAAQNGYLHYAGRVAVKWAQLADAVQHPEVAATNFLQITGEDAGTALAFAEAMDANAKSQAAFIVNQFDFAGHRILDVGAGAGTYSVAVGSRWADATATLLETPGMTPITNRFVQAANLSDRFTVVSGDYHEVFPAPPYDDVFLFAVVHQEPMAAVESLLQRAFTSLKDGGRLFVTSFFLDESRTAPPFSAMFGVEMLVMVANGRVYTFNEMTTLLGNAGFQNIHRRDDIPGPATLFVANH